MPENPMTAARSSWSAERSTLVAELVADCLRGSGSSCQSMRLRVHGESMLPTLWPGEVVEIAVCSIEDVRPGEIVLALRDGRLFLHRLVAIATPNGFLLRGDSMPGPDSLFPTEALLGRLVRRGGQAGRISASAWSRAIGTLLCHCGIARRLALKLHSRRSAPARDFNSETSAELGTL